MTGVPEPRGVTPVIAYGDAAGALQFLCSAFGFRPLRVLGGDRAIEIAYLSAAGGLIVIVQRDEWATQTDASSVGFYVEVNDLARHRHTAVAAGARMKLFGHADPARSRVYSCFDCEDYTWTFGQGQGIARAESPDPHDPRPDPADPAKEFPPDRAPPPSVPPTEPTEPPPPPIRATLLH